MKYLSSFFPLLLITFLVAACNSSKKATTQNETTTEVEKMEKPEVKKLVYYSQGACFGKCPVYTMLLTSDSTLHLEGKLFMNYIGFYTLKLKSNEFDELMSKLNKVDQNTLQDSYDSQIADIPMQEYLFFDDNNLLKKKVTTKGSAPNELQALAATLNKYTNSVNWKKNEKAADASVNQIIIQLVPGAEIKNVLPSYERYKAIVKDYISPSNLIYLIQFDQNVIDSERFLNLMKKDKNVLNAEKNINLELRKEKQDTSR